MDDHVAISRQTGRYIIQLTGYKAFMPAPLPPKLVPGLDGSAQANAVLLDAITQGTHVAAWQRKGQFVFRQELGGAATVIWTDPAHCGVQTLQFADGMGSRNRQDLNGATRCVVLGQELQNQGLSPEV